MKCTCGGEAALRTVNKDGPNKGRQFYTCTNRENSCKFFKWAEKEESSTTTPKTTPPKKSPTKEPVEDVEDIKCKCGEAKLQRVNKEGANNGRYFWSCPNKDDSCKFFLWCEHPEKYLRKQKDKKSTLEAEVTSVNEITVTTKNTEEETALKKIGAKQCNEVFTLPIDKASDLANIGGKIPDFVLKMIQPVPQCEVNWKKVPNSLRESLMPFQKSGVEFAIHREGRVLIGDEMGLGKSIQAIAIGAYYFSDWPLLIICPSQLRHNWKAEILKWMVHLDESDITTIESSKIGEFTLVNIISYDLIAKEDVCRQIEEEQFKIVIVDESHFIKSTNAKRSVSVCSIIENTERAILLSGTATPSRPFEVFTQIKSLSKIKGLSEKAYGDRYCEVAAYQPNQFASQKYTGAKRLIELNLILSRVMIRRLKSDVLAELPPKKRSVINLEISQKDMIDYKQKVEEKAEKMELYGTTAAVKVARVQQYIKTHLIPTKQKCLIFAHHRVMLNAIEETISSSNCGYIRIDGTTPMETRHEKSINFRNDDECIFAILGLTVAGTGLNFVPCSCVVFAELCWTPGVILQSEDRCHRIGADAKNIDVRFLIANNTLDDYMFKLIKKKLSVIGETLDGEGKRAGSGLFKDETSSKFVPGQKRLDVMFAQAEKNIVAAKPIENNVVVIDDEDEDEDVEIVIKRVVPKKRKSDEFESELKKTSNKKAKKAAAPETKPKLNTLDKYFKK